jgi:hypothetical protein
MMWIITKARLKKTFNKSNKSLIPDVIKYLLTLIESDPLTSFSLF